MYPPDVTRVDYVIQPFFFFSFLGQRLEIRTSYLAHAQTEGEIGNGVFFVQGTDKQESEREFYSW